MLKKLTTTIVKNVMYGSIYPKFQFKKTLEKCNQIRVISDADVQTEIPQKFRKDFKSAKNLKLPIDSQSIKQIFLDTTIHKIGHVSKNTYISFSQNVIKKKSFFGIASHIFSVGHKFSRKSSKNPEQAILYHDNLPQINYILQLAEARIRSRQMADTRGNQGNPQYFLKQADRISKQYSNINKTIFKGSQLLDQGFRLMHAVGRASKNQPIFINLSYKGDPQSQTWYSFIGKGVCFDTGGYNLKPTTSIKQMHMDKHGATSILSAFQSILKLKLKINLTISMGFVQNFVDSNAYRPLDVIQSRKGITVQIGNTDAQGRLVLADCMHWTQQKYKVKEMIELSTLTGAVIIALGTKYAGMFGNNIQMMNNFSEAGKQINQFVWQLPLEQYHHELIKSQQADITNSPGKSQAASSQAAAFLQRFVEDGVNWIHLDIAGTSNQSSKATGYGARLLTNYIRKKCS